MRLAHLSIRWRLTLWYAGVLALGLALFGAAWLVAVQHRLMDGVDQRLAQRVEGMQEVLHIEGAEGLSLAELETELAEFTQEVPDGNLIEVRDSKGRVILAGNPALLFLPVQTPRYQTVRSRRRALRILTSHITYRDQTYAVLVAGSLEEVRGVTRDLRNLLLLTLPGVLLVACLGGYWISRRALTPVDEITKAARSMSVQNLSERLAVPATGDELQRLSETWNTMLDRLQTAVRRISGFTADASHELRTPIALIRATADLALHREREPAEYREALRQIVTEADRMTSLTSDLLTLARSDSAALSMPLAPVNVNLLASEIVEHSKALATERGIDIAASPGNAPVSALANDSGLRRMLLILVDNALKHTPAGGRVEVAVRNGGNGVTLSVEDSGEGIEASALPHIFERFYRADPSRHRNGGVGLGLSIAQDIARAHGTEIQVESTPGAGSRFSLTLSAPRFAS